MKDTEIDLISPIDVYQPIQQLNQYVPSPLKNPSSSLPAQQPSPIHWN
jgi:hypothetical protein